jgi:hypothetical protein
MSEIMPKRVRGTHAFRALQQSRGAASNIQASSSEGKGKEKGKGKGKGKEKDKGKAKAKAKGKATEVDLELNDDGDNNNDKPTTSFLPPGPPFAVPSSSTSASISAASSAKRKYSALDGAGSILSSSHNSSSKKSKTRGATAIDGVKASLDTIGSSIRDMTAERKLRRLQQDARTDAQATQAVKLLASSPQRRHEAMQRLQQTETHLDPDRMIALVDLVSSDTIAADVYMTLEREDYRKAWISKRLKELGFVDGIAVDDT